MTTAVGQIFPAVRLDIIARVRAGQPSKSVGDELGMSASTVEKYTCHLPNGTKRDLVRASIVERLERGEYVATIASLEGCSLSFVLRIARAWAAERELHEPQAEPVPRVKRPKKVELEGPPEPTAALRKSSLLAVLSAPGRAPAYQAPPAQCCSRRVR